MKTFLTTMLVLIGSMSVTFAQTVNLDVLMGEKKIGDITATKTTKGKTVTASLSSKVNVTMLFQVNVESTIASEYKDGKLVKTEAARISNVKTENKKSSIVWDGNKYTITKEGSEPTTLAEPVSFCALDLYFKEPVGLTKVFSEMGGNFMPLTSLGDHRYQLQVNDTKKDTWVYNEKGKLVQVESVIAMNKVIFKMR